jgi:microcystin-dependent protein
MPSTYSPSLRLELIGDGDQSGIWGQTTNNNLGALLEQAISGVVTITMADANYTMSNYNGVVDEARNQVLVIAGALTATRNLVAPLVEKTYLVKNSTTGGQSIQIIGSSGLGVTIPNGITTYVYCDGTNFYNALSGSVGNFTVNGNLSVTGTTSLTGALSASTATFSGAISSVSPTFTGTPTAPTASAGTNTTQIATTAFVLTNGAPTGGLIMWGTGTAPSGWLLCAGAAVSRTTYAALFAVIGTTFGVGDGSTTFNLPNYTNRIPYGTTLAATGGSADAVVVSHTHTAAVTDPGHAHSYNPYGPTFYVGTGGSYAGVQGPQTTNTGSAVTGISVANSTEGVSGTNANLPPYLGINFIIKT